MKVALEALREHKVRFDEQVEIAGAGRAAFVLVANCSPYTYAGSMALDLVPGASFDDGLAYFAPVTLRARDIPRLALHGARGRGLPDGRALAARDLDRIVVRCDRPLPLQVDGEDAGRCPRGRLRGRARCSDGPRRLEATEQASPLQCPAR